MIDGTHHRQTLAAAELGDVLPDIFDISLPYGDLTRLTATTNREGERA